MRLHLASVVAILGNAWGCTFLNVAGSCTWLGDSPSCGSIDDDIHNQTNFHVRDFHPTRGYLMWWSVADNLGTNICKLERAGYPYLLGNCCGGFGNGCVTGYKRLWCKTWPGAPPPPLPVPSRPSLPVCRNPGPGGKNVQDNETRTDVPEHEVE